MTATTSIEGFVLSPQQRHFWELRQAGDHTPNIAFSCISIEGPAEPDILTEALYNLIARHEILRTNLQHLPGMRYPLQVVEAIAPLLCSRISAANLDEGKLDELIRSFVGAQQDMADRGRLRCLFVDIGPELCLLLLAMPAFRADTASLDFLVRELSASYAALLNVGSMPDISVQYAEVATVFNDLLKSPDARAGREFWFKKMSLEGLTSVLPFETAMPGQGFSPDVIKVPIGPDLLSRLSKMIAATSTQTVLLACWKGLLWKLTREPDVVIGTVYDGRLYEELGQALGLFARHLPVRSQMRAEQSWSEFLIQVDNTAAALSEWQDYFDWEHLTAFDQSRGLGFFPFCFELYEEPAPCTVAGVVFRPDRYESFFDRFKMKISARVRGENLLINLHFDSNLYLIDDAQRVAQYYGNILASIASNPRCSLGSISLISQQERRRALLDLNQVPVVAPADRAGCACLHTLVEDQVKRTPSAIAITDGLYEVTYAWLDDRANRLSQDLRQLGVGPEQMIGICIERSVMMVVALLGILKSGAAYIPLDPTYPEESLSSIIEDAGLSLILTDTISAETLTQYQDRLILLAADQSRTEAGPASNPGVAARGANPAYVIYTSGSTGHPKGVVVPHSAVCNRLMGDPVVRELAASDRILQIASICFDFSVWEVFAPLVAGAQLVLAPPRWQAFGPDLARFIAKHRITVAHFTPSLLHTILNADGLERCDSLHIVLCGGESLDSSLLNRLLERVPAVVFNQYGPTEACIDATAHTCEQTLSGDSVPIGRPLSNVHVYVSDPEMEIVPLELAGELYISGAGLARGYLSRPGLTAEVFLPDPWSTTPGSRVYKTGDIVRYRPNGELDFIGRNDQQVKIRGIRVELGEIEAVLNQHPLVPRAIVMASRRRDGDLRLIAYIVSAQPGLDADNLRSYLRQRLPEFMVPAVFALIDTLPLTTTGKVDRAALSEPDRLLMRAKAYVAPTGSVERGLAVIWRELLGIERVGVFDNFFDVGGYSLLMAQLQESIRTRLGFNISLVELFQYPTISALAQRLAINGNLTDAVTQADDRSTAREGLRERRTRSREARREARAERNNGMDK